MSDDFQRRLIDAWEQVPEGAVFTHRRTFTDGDVAMFCGVTGDLNPYHQDELFSRESFFGRLIVPGLLTASMATHIGGMIGFVAATMSFEYLKPVYIGDTVRCTVTVVSKDAAARRLQCTCSYVNQDGVEVLRGAFTGFPSHVRLAR